MNEPTTGVKKKAFLTGLLHARRSSWALLLFVCVFVMMLASCAPVNYPPSAPDLQPQRSQRGYGRRHVIQHSLLFQIVNAYGKPVSGLPVVIKLHERDSKRPSWIKRETDKKGRFRLPVTSGQKGILYINPGSGLTNQVAYVHNNFYLKFIVNFNIPYDKGAVQPRVWLSKSGEPRHVVNPNEVVSYRLKYSPMKKSYDRVQELYKKGDSAGTTIAARKYLERYSHKHGSLAGNVEGLLANVESRKANDRYRGQGGYYSGGNQDRQKRVGSMAWTDRVKTPKKRRPVKARSELSKSKRKVTPQRCRSVISVEKFLDSRIGSNKGTCVELTVTPVIIKPGSGGVFMLIDRHVYITFKDAYKGGDLSGLVRIVGMKKAWINKKTLEKMPHLEVVIDN